MSVTKFSLPELIAFLSGLLGDPRDSRTGMYGLPATTAPARGRWLLCDTMGQL